MSGVRAKVLFIYNDHVATEALLGEAFLAHGFDVDTFEVVPAARGTHAAGDVEFPDPTGYDVIVPLGARWAVYDPALLDTWVTAEAAMLRDAAAAGVALLGVCFGGQLLAHAFGGSVTRAPVPEIGWYDVDSTDHELIPPGRWFQWHADRWTLPPGAVEVARTAGASQAFLLGRTLGLQFHPEVDRPLLETWLADDDGELAAFGITSDELRSQTTTFVDTAKVQRLVEAFVTRVARQPCPSS
ncbi:type 1 glutamine amidotransferase [Mycolicibacterium flavescens]|uniref:Glutamine amidotransferase n=1 Tax=Mycolicibacterium flavescens TaxID=1776 RepID=A0A1E3RAW5_MYCFV|nr:glutamine amidotransferase [Mycolicibacterium flavescens]MCV7280965.1 type 1 glutamine amidotransferase [Mycolicibacterium flavescens]ODQ87003.1 glutamine amidotransferase [Mycolicibacterium flavescens]